MLSDSRSRTSAEPSGSVAVMRAGRLLAPFLTRQARCAPVAVKRIHRCMEKKLRSARLRVPGCRASASRSTRCCSLRALLSWAAAMIHRVPQVTRVTRRAWGYFPPEGVAYAAAMSPHRGEVEHGAVERGEQQPERVRAGIRGWHDGRSVFEDRSHAVRIEAGPRGRQGLAGRRATVEHLCRGHWQDPGQDEVVAFAPEQAQPEHGGHRDQAGQDPAPSIGMTRVGQTRGDHRFVGHRAQNPAE